MTIKDLKDNNLIILECISGSRAYGLDTATSDTDIKGVFLLPKEDFYGLNYIPQISDKKNDVVYYEFGRFMELLSVNNPNILELLNTPEGAVLYKHPILNQLDSSLILSKLCKNTFGKFALSQIKKSKGLNKKMVNPIAKERKSVLSFCYINHDNGSIPLLKFLEINHFKQEHCGLININNMKNIYGFYHNKNADFKGVVNSETANDVKLSSIPKNVKQVALLYFNKDGYSKYCKEYKQYWEWVENRNESRYVNTQNHGKNYDAKNMMHTFRLLEMAIEIGNTKMIHVKRPDRKFLLSIKNGHFEYDELLKMAKKKQDEMEIVFQNSDLPAKPNLNLINKLSFEIRNKLYNTV